jgi:AcrR family transcriptional regulator
LAAAPSTTAAQGRKRSEVSRKAILDATYELLKTVGFHQMSIEGVAARAGPEPRDALHRLALLGAYGQRPSRRAAE